MKQKSSRWLHIATAVVRKYLALDMAVYAGSATLFLHFWRLSYIYGSLTAVILVILWLFVIINLIFLGAGLNAELNGAA